MKQYWQQLNERERLTLIIGGFFTLAYLMYALVIAPMHNSITEKTQQRQIKAESLAWMTQASSKISQHNTKQQSISNNELLTVIDDELANSDIHRFSYQLQQTSSGDIELSFDQVAFTPFITWLWQFNNKYVFTIKELNSNKTNTSGVVKLNIVISAA